MHLVDYIGDLLRRYPPAISKKLANSPVPKYRTSLLLVMRKQLSVEFELLDPMRIRIMAQVVQECCQNNQLNGVILVLAYDSEVRGLRNPL